MDQVKETELFRGPADIESISRVMEAVREYLTAGGIPKEDKIKLLVAADELYANICSYSGAREAAVRCVLAEDGAGLIFEDDGIPYNPLERPEPDVTLGAEERKIGGLGIYMVRKTMDEVKYEHVDGKNRLMIIKKKNILN